MARHQPRKHVCRAGLIKAHFIDSRMSLAEYAAAANVSEHSIRKAMKGGEMSPGVVEALATHIGIARADLIEAARAGSMPLDNRSKREFHMELTLDGFCKLPIEIRSLPDLLTQALDSLDISGVKIFRQSSKAVVTGADDASFRIPVRLIGMARDDRSGYQGVCGVWYAAIKPSAYASFLERVVWQSLHLRDVCEFGELIVWGDQRIRFGDHKSLLTFLGSPAVRPDDPEHFRGFWLSLVGFDKNPVGVAEALSCELDLSDPVTGARFLKSLYDDILRIKHELGWDVTDDEHG